MSNENIEIVKSCYAAFGRGDIEALMSYMSDDLTRFGVVTHAKTAVPWYLSLTKKSDVPRYFAALVSAVEHTKFEPFQFATTGEYVYVSIKMELKIRKNGRPIDLHDVVHRIRIKDGKVVEWRAFDDTATTEAAFRS